MVGKVGYSLPMPLTLDLPPDVEARLFRRAEREGVDAGTYAASAIRERLSVDAPIASAGSPPLRLKEAELLERINVGLPETDWRRYDALIARRNTESLASGEQDELIALTDRIERANAERVGHLAELARLRGISLGRLAEQLGIGPRRVAGRA